MIAKLLHYLIIDDDQTQDNYLDKFTGFKIYTQFGLKVANDLIGAFGPYAPGKVVLNEAER